jgi:hypothetical protein
MSEPPVLARNRMLTILCWGGIGDTLRNLALIPHERIYRTFGWRCRVVHRNWHDCLCLPHAGAPEPAFFKDLIDRIPSLEWRGESGEHTGLSRSLNRLLRDALRVWNLGRTRYYPFTVTLSEAERAALPPKAPGWHLGLQTHLSGMLTKRWALENWRAVIERILAAHPGCRISLFDTSAEVDALCFDPRITSTRGLNLAQSMNLIPRLDLLVSVDSWTKYAAAWSGLPQIVIVPDMTSEYGALTAEKLSRVEFAGILEDPKNTVLGIEGKAPHCRLTIPRMADLEPERLFAAIDRAIRRGPRTDAERWDALKGQGRSG